MWLGSSNLANEFTLGAAIMSLWKVGQGKFGLVYLFWLVWLGRFGSVGLVWQVWFGKFSLVDLVWFGRFILAGLVFMSNFSPKIFLKSFCQKRYQSKKKVCSKKIFSKNSLIKKKFRSKNIWSGKGLVQKKFWSKNYVDRIVNSFLGVQLVSSWLGGVLKLVDIPYIVPIN